MYRLTFIRLIAGSFIEEPPSDIQLVEGQTVELEYKLLNIRLTATFLKNNFFLPALKNHEKIVYGVWRILKITNITKKDVGMYCLEVAGHRSRLSNMNIKRMKLIFRVFTYLLCPSDPAQHAHAHTHTHTRL